MEKELDLERFEKGMGDLRRLNEVLERVYFGDIEYYLEEMSRESNDPKCLFKSLKSIESIDKESHNYKESLDSFRDFKPIFQRLALALRKLPNFR